MRRLGGALVVFAAFCAVAMVAFNLGVMRGAATATAALVIYSVPATLFDWPRVTLSDVIELISGFARAVVGFLASLFGW